MVRISVDLVFLWYEVFVIWKVLTSLKLFNSENNFGVNQRFDKKEHGRPGTPQVSEEGGGGNRDGPDGTHA